MADDDKGTGVEVAKRVLLRTTDALRQLSAMASDAGDVEGVMAFTTAFAATGMASFAIREDKQVELQEMLANFAEAAIKSISGGGEDEHLQYIKMLRAALTEYKAVKEIIDSRGAIH